MGLFDWSPYKAALFDLDGVLTPTTQVHRQAWRELFDGFLSARGCTEPYSDQDYFDHIDGKPRYDGVRDLLSSRGLFLPEGDPADALGTETVCGLGNRKNELFREVLSREGVQAYPGALALMDALDHLGIRMAVVSSSRNAADVLAAAGIAHRFAVVTDGNVALAEHLAGKPAADTFQFAARRLGVPYEQAVVLEDATSGVAAGRAGGFGAVIGIDRGAGAQALTEAGATLVVQDPAELVPASNEGARR